MHVCVCEGQRTTFGVMFLGMTVHLILRQDWSRVCRLSKDGWLDSLLCLIHVKITSVYHHSYLWLFNRVLGTKLRSLCLQSKHFSCFTNCSNSPAHMRFFYVALYGTYCVSQGFQVNNWKWTSLGSGSFWFLPGCAAGLKPDSSPLPAGVMDTLRNQELFRSVLFCFLAQ